MTIDPNLSRRGEFPVDQPMDALRTDHELVRQSFERYFRTQDAEEKKDVGRHILSLLEMHTSLEEQVFYPRVHDAVPAVVDRCMQEHEQAKPLIERLTQLGESDPQHEQDFRQLADSILKHLDNEEQQLFPQVQQANLDLAAIGQEMQDFEIRMIAARLQRPVAPGMRL